MKVNKTVWTGLLYGIAMFIVITDAKTAYFTAKEGLFLCLQTLIPSLFPLIFLSLLVCSSMRGQRMCFMRPIGRLCSLPEGAEGLLLLGFLGGYPVGAQSVTQAYESGQLQKTDAKRMLGYCNNAGPAFIFGITSSLFTSPAIPWALWLIHIISALITGFLLPNKQHSASKPTAQSSLSIPQALEKSIKIMASICGWVILFKTIQGFADRWLLWLLPEQMRSFFYGILELSNGCLSLSSLPGESMRFILCSAFLGFGGLCVGFQTLSVVHSLGCGMYFPGKILHCLLSTFFAALGQFILFPINACTVISPFVYILLAVLIACTVLRLRDKKTVAFQKQIVYNKFKIM